VHRYKYTEEKRKEKGHNTNKSVEMKKEARIVGNKNKRKGHRMIIEGKGREERERI
jgi:hypothetical protein